MKTKIYSRAVELPGKIKKYLKTAKKWNNNEKTYLILKKFADILVVIAKLSVFILIFLIMILLPIAATTYT